MYFKCLFSYRLYFHRIYFETSYFTFASCRRLREFSQVITVLDQNKHTLFWLTLNCCSLVYRGKRKENRMGVLQRVVKPRNQKSKKALENREPKCIENNKSSLFIRGANCSQKLVQCLRDLNSLKKPDSEFYSHKNDIRPFEDFTKLEFFSQKHDVALFAVGTHNKKRPDNLILGRFYDHKMLDMIEFGMENFKSLAEFATEKIPIGTKPCLLFSGSLFETNEEMKRAKNLLIDFFRGPKVPNIRLQGLGKIISNATKNHSDIISLYNISYRTCNPIHCC